MYITNKATPGEILAQLITRSGAKAREQFKDLKHNDDLCSAFRERVDSILTAYSRHRASGEDIQGRTDEGVDVLLTYEDFDGQRTTFALQIKAYDELESEVKRLKEKTAATSLVDLLTNQYRRSRGRHRPETYFIVLCGDGGKRHRDVVRSVCAAFTGLEDVKVITPDQAWGLFELEDWDIAAYCSRILCAEDYVLKRAREAFGDESAEYRRMAVYAVITDLETRSPISADELHEALEDEEVDWGDQSMVDTINQLEFDGILRGTDGNEWEVVHDVCDEVKALYYDLRIRHGIGGADAIQYINALLD